MWAALPAIESLCVCVYDGASGRSLRPATSTRSQQSMQTSVVLSSTHPIMCAKIALALLIVGVAATSAANLPDKFYGSFDLDHSENFDEYLTAKGYGWFTRKLVTFATFKKVFTKTDKKNLFDYSNLTSKKDVHYKNIELGKAFEGEGLDSTKHEITFTLKDGHLFEHHKPLEGGDAKEETYEYLFDGDFLLVRMSFNGVEGRRFYKRLP